MIPRLPIAMIGLALAGCSNGSTASISADDAIQRANADFADTLPQVPLKLLTIEAVDEGNQWRVVYRPPEGSTGQEALSIMVDKKTGDIVESLKGPNYGKERRDVTVPTRY